MRTPQNDFVYLSRLQDYYARHRSIPSYDRLSVLWGVASRSVVSKILERFRRQELLERTPDGDWVPSHNFFERFMALQPVQAGNPGIDLQAGMTPTFLDDLLVDTPSRTMLLKVRGDSMSGVNILDGDVVIVERQHQAESGEIVVALVDQEMTIKTLIKTKRGWVLRPENPDFAEIHPEGELQLLGVVTGLARKLTKPQR